MCASVSVNVHRRSTPSKAIVLEIPYDQAKKNGITCLDSLFHIVISSKFKQIIKEFGKSRSTVVWLNHCKP
jgi:hypothetical protein